MQYGRKCLLCKNTRKREPSCRLFKFPARGSPMWHRWLEACGLRESDMNARSREPPRLCQLHFQKKDFLTRQLTGMAVPSVFPATVYTEVADVGSQRWLVQGEAPTKGVSNEILQLDPQEEVFDSVIEYSEVSAEGSEGSVSGISEEVRIVVRQGQSCSVEQHQTLMEDLRKEQDKVESLSREMIEKDTIIRKQHEVLKQMGVQMITFTEPTF
ncbi:uncharacterized protein LOC134214556 [Armigeres subalbatus]|uniref:uncharacterized protein LOC134214556 n=1 Tax=Armigeres subalbatus TaxID=124917 RepID=UPI002ED103C9